MSLLKIAHVPPATVEPGATVFEAVSVMAREGVGAVAVVEKAAKSQLQGIFTERDVMLRVVQQERNPRETQVGDVMTSPVEAASEETTAEEALTLMLERHLRHLPIVASDKQLLGMLSIRNLLEDQVEDLKRELTFPGPIPVERQSGRLDILDIENFMFPRNVRAPDLSHGLPYHSPSIAFGHPWPGLNSDGNTKVGQLPSAADRLFNYRPCDK